MESRKKPPTLDDYKARGGFIVSKMQPGVVAMLETTVGVMYTLRLVDPFQNIVDFWTSDEVMRQQEARRCYFVASWMDRVGVITIPDWVVKDGRMLLRFTDANLLCHPVRSVLLEHPNWKYEVITP